MILLSAITLLVHILAIAVLLTTIPRQLYDIFRETDARYRKICWVILTGTICLVSSNVLPLLEPFFYDKTRELQFNSFIGIFNALIGIILGVLAHIMYKSTKKTVPRAIDDIDSHMKNDRN